MLTTPEKILFILAVAVSLYFTWRGVARILRILARGKGKPDWGAVPGKVGSAIINTITLRPTFRLRPAASIFHALVAWGFIYYILVNIGDVLQAYLPGFVFFGSGVIGNLYLFGADLLTVGVLAGLAALLVRRYIFRPAVMQVRDQVLLHPQAKAGIQRDSAIVGGFIFLHIGGRFVGESLRLAGLGETDPWQPFASALSLLWQGMSPAALTVAEHAAFWFALGLILAFLPYFPYSKHIHIFFTPLNFALKPSRRSMGELSALNFEDESIEQFGATRLEDLGWEQIMDAYACIMCFRCQEVCPAYTTGKALSPAALEINKRCFFNFQGGEFSGGTVTEQPLTEMVISEEAVWACTACGACIDICPVGNEPMRDILDVRRALVLMDNSFPDTLKSAYRGMERTANPWNIPSAERMKWAEGFEVPTIRENPEADLLWWVGCAPATDARAQKTAQAFARLLKRAGVNFAVLGEEERCSGDAARRSGKEDLFYELALGNIETLKEVAPKRIVTTCPHCLHTIKNEYPAYGGTFEVIHHTQLLKELVDGGNLRYDNPAGGTVVYHDPCFLGRQNEIYTEPRALLSSPGQPNLEAPLHGARSFCCGAGGGQMWKEEEEGTEKVSIHRLKELLATHPQELAVACPFCLTMFTDGSKSLQSTVPVKDICEIMDDWFVVAEAGFTSEGG